MGSVYDDVDLEDMTWKPEERTFFYPCPCGDKFYITLDELLGGEDIARCPSCSLRIRVIFDEESISRIEQVSSQQIPAQ